MTPIALAGLPPGTGSIALVAILAAVAYLIECAWHPYQPCDCCNRAGIHTSPDNRHWRDCTRCGGTGKHHRPGRRLLTRMRSKR